MLFIPRKFREASSNETGFKPFYGSNFCEIFDNHAPLTVLRYTLWTHLIEYRCCILMVRERSLLKEVAVDRRNHRGRLPAPCLLSRSRRCTPRRTRTRKVRSEIRLILFGEVLRSVSDCLMHCAASKPSRSRRDRGNWYWLRVRPSGLTSDTQDDYIIFHRQLSPTSPATVMIYRWIIARAAVPSPREYEFPSTHREFNALEP